MPEGIGYRWLIERYGLAVTQALRIETVIGPTRATASDGITERRTVQELLRPEATLAGHLGFALKHEGIHLEALSRLFAAAPAALKSRSRESKGLVQPPLLIATWCRDEP